MPLSFIAKNKITELKAFGISDLTPEEIVALHECGSAVEDPTIKNFLRGRGLPAIVGNVTLYPMTARAAGWWESYCSWFADSAKLSTIALGFVLAHGRHGDQIEIKSTTKIIAHMIGIKRKTVFGSKTVTLEEIIDRGTAIRAVVSWFQNCTCTIAELDEATGYMLNVQGETMRDLARHAITVLMDHFSGQREHLVALCNLLQATEKESKSESVHRFLTWRQYANELAVLTGTDAEYWMDQNRDEMVRCYAMAREHQRSKEGTPGFALNETEEAIKALNTCAIEITERRKKKEAVSG